MIFGLLAATIYLPVIVVCMIISQIYFERYWLYYNQVSFTTHWLFLAIVVSYFIQEFCLLQLSMLNIHEICFTLVVPVTMIFRQNSHKIWWWLLGLTPFFVTFVEVYLGSWPMTAWGYPFIQALIFLGLCWLLTKWTGIKKRYRYFIAVACLGIFELISLFVNHRLTIERVAAATIGLLVVMLLEQQRHLSEERNGQKIKMLKRNSERDDLTGLLNYRALSEEVAALDKRANINQIVIGALDIDHFKHVNDTYGHFVGNDVLNYFSKVFMKQIHTAFPHHGYVYRFGGEEFSIVVSNYSLSDVYQVLQKIEDFFNEHEIQTSQGIKIKVSFSCSLTNRLNNESLDDTLKRADKMLYSVKNNGRGWIVTDHHKK